MSIFAVCVCAARWIFVPVFPRAPCLGKIQREVSELFWPVQMVYELMRSMWRGRCSLDTPREYWVFSVFFSLSLSPLLTESKPAPAQRTLTDERQLLWFESDTSGTWWKHKDNRFFMFFLENALVTFGSETDPQPTLSQSGTTSPGLSSSSSSSTNRSTTSPQETIETMRNILDTIIPTQVGSFLVVLSAASHHCTYSREHSWQRHEVVFS